MNIKNFLNEYGYSKEFSLAVRDETDSFSAEDIMTEVKNRKCFFDIPVITIDGDDSKDFDDAVSIKKFKNGKFELGVHIADVSHYVKENSALDEAAFARGTSVYLAKHAVNMLPAKLSDDLCSLLPEKVRLTVSCVMRFNENGALESHKILKSAIKSAKRFTYRDVTRVLEGDMAARNEYKNYIVMLENMRELALILRDRRMRRGAIDFDFAEPYFDMDENDNVTEIYPRNLSVSNRIIEEFMLAANETVAAHCAKNKIPCVYRVHEKPEREKIEKLSKIVGVYGHRLKVKDNISPKSIQNMLFSADGTNALPVIGVLTLRSMMKARYFEQNLGHFGLAAENYCHFTSPIRRYSDLLTHRILKEHLDGALDEKRILHYNKYVKKASEQATETEIAAVAAERDFNSLLYCEYMQDKVGQKFFGTVSSVTDFGFFVELQNTAEGLVRMADLKDDYYEYDEETMTLFGKRTGRTFCIGQKVCVVLAKVNVKLRQTDFVLEEFNTPKPEKEVKRKSGKRRKGSKKKHRSK